MSRPEEHDFFTTGRLDLLGIKIKDLTEYEEHLLSNVA